MHVLLRRAHSPTHHGWFVPWVQGSQYVQGVGLGQEWKRGPGSECRALVCFMVSSLSMRGLLHLFGCVWCSVSPQPWPSPLMVFLGVVGVDWGLGAVGGCWEGGGSQAPSCILPSLLGPLAHPPTFLQVSVVRVFNAWVEHKGDVLCPSVTVFQTASLWCQRLRCSERTIFLSEFQVGFRELPSFERHALLPGNCLDR